jgi:hypothetical protein
VHRTPHARVVLISTAEGRWEHAGFTMLDWLGVLAR